VVGPARCLGWWDAQHTDHFGHGRAPSGQDPRRRPVGVFLHAVLDDVAEGRLDASGVDRQAVVCRMEGAADALETVASA